MGEGTGVIPVFTTYKLEKILLTCIVWLCQLSKFEVSKAL